MHAYLKNCCRSGVELHETRNLMSAIGCRNRPNTGSMKPEEFNPSMNNINYVEVAAHHTGSEAVALTNDTAFASIGRRGRIATIC